MIKLFFTIFTTDRLSKTLARKLKKSVQLGKHIELNHTENKGLAFSLFNNMANVPAIINSLGILSLCISVILRKKLSKMNKYGFVILLSGAVSNMTDRLLQGSVTDMIRFPTAPYKLKQLIFNFSDFCVLIGSVMLTFKQKTQINR